MDLQEFRRGVSELQHVLLQYVEDLHSEGLGRAGISKSFMAQWFAKDVDVRGLVSALKQKVPDLLVKNYGSQGSVKAMYKVTLSPTAYLSLVLVNYTRTKSEDPGRTGLYWKISFHAS